VAADGDDEFEDEEDEEITSEEEDDEAPDAVPIPKVRAAMGRALRPLRRPARRSRRGNPAPGPPGHGLAAAASPWAAPGRPAATPRAAAPPLAAAPPPAAALGTRCPPAPLQGSGRGRAVQNAERAAMAELLAQASDDEDEDDEDFSGARPGWLAGWRPPWLAPAAALLLPQGRWGAARRSVPVPHQCRHRGGPRPKQHLHLSDFVLRRRRRRRG
jgi:hypothetical protein